MQKQTEITCITILPIFLINDNVKPENYRKAVSLYAIIPEDSKQYNNAQLALGDIYAEGKGGISKDNTRAFMYYNNAYTKGATLNSKQKENLGDAYYNGKGTAVNKEKALEVYTDGKYGSVFISTLNYKYIKTAVGAECKMRCFVIIIRLKGGYQFSR